MKISELWLREWIGSDVSRDEFCQQLTMAGIEVESVMPVAGEFSNVVVANVLHVEPHPEADRLQICTVDHGEEIPLSVVCGAKNVRIGMKAAFAKEGAVLPNGMKIRKAKLRGVASCGMLCSAVELGLTEESDGLLVLPDDAPIGKVLREYMQFDDHIIEVSITPNRGDCLSIAGLAHEIAALTHCEIVEPVIENVEPLLKDTFSVVINEKEKCPHYVGRVIRKINKNCVSPLWLQERLRRSGIRSIHPVVDIMNYVMIELGQPMHAFDLSKLSGNICVRHANPDEDITLLDGRTVSLQPETLVIADQEGPQAIAGTIGGLLSGVTSETSDLFLESAYFQPVAVAASARAYYAYSESSHRFERGVDPTLQKKAIERATQLILDIVGGQPGPVIEVIDDAHLPSSKKIILRRERLHKISGMQTTDQRVYEILTKLGFEITPVKQGWEVIVPSRRFDIKLEVDLIEEVLRIDGYQNISSTPILAHLQSRTVYDEKIASSKIAQVLIAQNYHEVITYSFVDEKIQTLLNPDIHSISLVNPISSEMNVMRTSLWPGLINVLQYNFNRQQSQIRIFEMGTRFLPNEEQQVVSGLITGPVFPMQWGAKEREVDFFDLKGDIENILRLSHLSDFRFETSTHSSLHPGQSADIYRGAVNIGSIGLLHPTLMKALDLTAKIYLFELQLSGLNEMSTPVFVDISKFPAIRRDVAIIVNETIPALQIQATISHAAGELLQSVTLFDVYQGKGVPPAKKSMAFSLVLQHASRTLTDDEVANLMQRVYSALQETYAAELRSST